MNRFEVGDKAIIVNTPFSSGNGQEVTITSSGELMYNEVFPNGVIVYEVDMYLCENWEDADRIGMPEPCLRPFYDGNEKTEGDESIFKPKELVVCPNELQTQRKIQLDSVE